MNKNVFRGSLTIFLVLVVIIVIGVIGFIKLSNKDEDDSKVNLKGFIEIDKSKHLEEVSFPDDLFNLFVLDNGKDTSVNEDVSMSLVDGKFSVSLVKKSVSASLTGVKSVYYYDTDKLLVAAILNDGSVYVLNNGTLDYKNDSTLDFLKISENVKYTDLVLSRVGNGLVGKDSEGAEHLIKNEMVLPELPYVVLSDNSFISLSGYYYDSFMNKIDSRVKYVLESNVDNAIVGVILEDMTLVHVDYPLVERNVIKSIMVNDDSFDDENYTLDYNLYIEYNDGRSLVTFSSFKKLK